MGEWKWSKKKEEEEERNIFPFGWFGYKYVTHNDLQIRATVFPPYHCTPSISLFFFLAFCFFLWSLLL